MFKKILIANRGEIAVRIIRTCKEMGIKTVAVYSEADRKSLHVLLSDEAYFLGPASSNESYLRMDKIIDIAKRAGVSALHPGYGFLAENPIFAEMTEREGIKFIGPTPQAMKAMGDKVFARRTVSACGVPVVPGVDRGIKEVEDGVKIANSIGFPVLIKAAMGGGGKGMRIVMDEEEFMSLFRLAQTEALASFGDGTLYIEKFLKRPRHIEFQILADEHGNIIHLCERECSVQRRYQKLIEESPSPVMDDFLRRKMGESAVAVAKSVGYTNAGTIEFLLDEDKNFYFLEMNTRLQVEHPVTEMVVGIDIVKEQIKISSGERLSFSQDEVVQKGSAIECRINAEDPFNDFFPAMGKVINLRVPGGFGVRFDGGIYSGAEISMFYDPLIAKLITCGENRDEVIKRMRRALSELEIEGIITTIPLYKKILESHDFISGNYDTSILERVNLKDKFGYNGKSKEIVAIAASLIEYLKTQIPKIPDYRSQILNRWKVFGREESLRK